MGSSLALGRHERAQPERVPVLEYACLSKMCGITCNPRRDQILLNGLVFSGALRNVSHQLQRRGEGLVNTVRYAFEALPRATRWNYAPEEAAAASASAIPVEQQSRPSLRSRRSTKVGGASTATRFFPHRLPFSIFNSDNATLSAVVHQYDVDKVLSRALDAAALVYRNTSSVGG